MMEYLTWDWSCERHSSESNKQQHNTPLKHTHANRLIWLQPICMLFFIRVMSYRKREGQNLSTVKVLIIFFHFIKILKYLHCLLTAHITNGKHCITNKWTLSHTVLSKSSLTCSSDLKFSLSKSISVKWQL